MTMIATLQPAEPIQAERPCAVPARPAPMPPSMTGAARAVTTLAEPESSRAAVQPPHAPTREFMIQGLTREGRRFRPSDWSERLAGAMSRFRPEGGVSGISAFIGYSPYCIPSVADGVRCVIVNEALRDIEPMAWDFVMNFARDNDLRLVEVNRTHKPQ